MIKRISITIMALLFFALSCKKTPTTPPQGTPPTINSFTVSPASIYQGETATLSWSVSNADIVIIDQGIGNVALSGNKSINPDRDTTYSLTASNKDGTRNASTSLIVKWNLSGSWRGTTRSSSAGTQSITFTITQNGPNVSGTWVSSIGYSGTMAGTVSGNSLSGNLVAGGGYYATASGTISNFGRQIDGSGTDNYGPFTFGVTKQ